MKKYVQIKDRPLTLNEAIDKALSAPFPQIAVHHLIDRLFMKFEPDPENPELLIGKPELRDE